MTDERLQEMLDKHEKWVSGDPQGERADFSYENLQGKTIANVNLSSASFRRANLVDVKFKGVRLVNVDFSEADLMRADLSSNTCVGANMQGADLMGANLQWSSFADANFIDAQLIGANMRHAYFAGANLSGANLHSANLFHADLFRAKLTGVKTNNYTLFFASQCPEEGSFIAWKVCTNNVLVKLLIPEDAKRSSATSRKCRASKAIVLDIIGADVATSIRNPYFLYEKGKEVTVYDFNEDRWLECASGIHFFLTKEEAKQFRYR